MDAVGHILAERGRDPLPWGPAVVLAVLLHAGAAGTLLVAALSRPSRLVAPRAVSVRILPAGSLRGGASARPAAAQPEKRKILKVAEEEAPPPSEKAKILPSREPKKKAPEKPAPAAPRATAPEVSLPSPTGEAGGETGGQAGLGGSVGVGGATLDQADFQYSYYVERMLVQIGMNWFKPAQSGEISPIIHFSIERDGTITDAEVQKSSSLPFVDRAALRAVIASSPLPPLPSDWKGDRLGVQLIFR
jgi:protein TonB